MSKELTQTKMKPLSHHFSHPHALKLSKLPKKEDDNDEDQKCCSACEQQLPISADEEEAYTCPKRDCEFVLHKSCFELPKSITHKSHPNHKLTLISEPPQFSIYFDCNACGSLINGFSFHCEKCDFKLHVKCAFLPESVDCKAHDHALAVRHYTPKPKASNENDYCYNNMITCGVCQGYVTEGGYWSYFCKDCDFCTHLKCAFVAEAPMKEEEEEEDEQEDQTNGAEEEEDDDDEDHTKMKHLSHHLSHPHGLKLFKFAKIEDDDQEQKCCSGCEQQIPISGDEEEAYTCPKRDCDFFLHKSCFELPKTLTHKSHTNHKLTLISEPPQFSIYFDCNACGSLIKGFSFHCEKCKFKIHVKCAFLAESVHCKAHEHALSVRHYTPKGNNEDDYYNMITCGVCDRYITEGYWSYLCKDCDFSTHVECAFVAEAPVKEEETEEEYDDEEEGLTDIQRLHRAQIKAMDQMARLQFQTQMAQMNASFVGNLFRTKYY